MSWFNSFSTFGMARFSSEPTQAEKMYRSLRNAYGPSFQGPVAEARIYAHAMALGIAQCELDRAAGQFRADRMTEMLAGKEKEYGLVPAVDANMKTRRAGLAAAQKLRNGARLDAMEDGLADILGSAFVDYVVNDAVSNRLEPVPSVALVKTNSGPYKSVMTPIQVVQIAEYVMPSGTAQTVTYSHFCGEDTPLKVGDTLAVDPSINGICEPVTITAVTPTTFSAIFSKPHDPGTLATTAPMPNWASWQRNVLCVVTTATVNNVALMRKAYNFLNKWTRITTVWSIVADSGSGHGAGPFKVADAAYAAAHPGAVGLIGETPIGTVTY